MFHSFDKEGKLRTEWLQDNAGKNPVEDARNSGYILAIKDLLNIHLDKVQGA